MSRHSTIHAPSALVLLIVFLAEASSLAQELPIVNEFSMPGWRRLSSFGDLDADGRDDVVLSTFGGAVSPTGNPTWSSEVVSGADGTPFFALPTSFLGGPSTITRYLGDLDGDGDGEFVTMTNDAVGIGSSTQYSSTIRVGSGVGNIQVFQVSTGSFAGITSPANYVEVLRVEPVGDVDADGVIDLGIQWVFDSGSGAALTAFTLVSTMTQATLFQTISGVSPVREFCAVDDVDADGHADFLLATSIGLSQLNGGTVGIFSGADFSVLRSWTGTQPNELFGDKVFSVKDLDGDEVRDIVVSAPGWANGGFPIGRVTAYSSVTGNIVWQTQGASISQFFGPFSIYEAVGETSWDFDGDGFRDCPTQFTYSRILSGRDGSDIDSPTNPRSFGSNRFRIGDTNGDGICELLFDDVAPPVVTGMPAPGTVTSFWMSQNTGVRTFGAPSPGSSLSLGWRAFSATPREGQIELSGAGPGASLWIGLSLVAGNGSLIQGQHPLWISPLPGELFGVTPVTADTTGSYRVPVNLYQPAFDGMKLFAQVAQLTLPDSVSNGLEMLFTD